MPDLPIHELFRQHVGERPFWESVAQGVAERLRDALRHARVAGKVEARAKTTGSVIGKAYRKPESYSSLAAFRDLAGVRGLVPFPADVEPVAAELKGRTDLEVLSDDVKVRAPNELRYQARHLDVQLRLDEWALELPDGFGDRPVICEVQLQTFAQSLWANISHLVTYKKDLPDELHSRVNRLVVLCELFDDEATTSRELAAAISDDVGTIAEELQQYFYGITGVRHDPEQAVALVAQLMPALEEAERTRYASTLDAFVTEYSDRLTLLLADRPEARGIPWLLRPEIILILERLTHRPALLSSVWSDLFPQADLDALQAAWGPPAS